MCIYPGIVMRVNVKSQCVKLKAIDSAHGKVRAVICNTLAPHVKQRGLQSDKIQFEKKKRKKKI